MLPAKRLGVGWGGGGMCGGGGVGHEVGEVETAIGKENWVLETSFEPLKQALFLDIHYMNQ